MKENQCVCRFISLGDKLYEWCKLCGRLAYRYDDCSSLPFSAIVNTSNSLSYDKTDHIIQRTRFVEPINIRDFLNHTHNFFVLSATDAWCMTCGTLRVRRSIMGTGLNVEVKEGFILPQRRQSYIDIRREAKLPITSNNEGIFYEK